MCVYLVLAAVVVSARWAPLQPISGGKQMTKLMTQTRLISSFVLTLKVLNRAANDPLHCFSIKLCIVWFWYFTSMAMVVQVEVELLTCHHS